MLRDAQPTTTMEFKKTACSPLKKSHLKAHFLSMTQQREGNRGQHFANQHDALEQLDGVLASMFKLMANEVEPYIEQQQTIAALKSYKSLAQNLIKSLKIQKKNEANYGFE